MLSLSWRLLILVRFISAPKFILSEKNCIKARCLIIILRGTISFIVVIQSLQLDCLTLLVGSQSSIQWAWKGFSAVTGSHFFSQSLSSINSLCSGSLVLFRTRLFNLTFRIRRETVPVLAFCLIHILYLPFKSHVFFWTLVNVLYYQTAVVCRLC